MLLLLHYMLSNMLNVFSVPMNSGHQNTPRCLGEQQKLIKLCAFYSQSFVWPSCSIIHSLAKCCYFSAS